MSFPEQAEERATINPKSPLWGEHRSRYRLATSYVTGKRVLDIACGTGFGEQILSDAGPRFIVAADYSFEALRVTAGLSIVDTHAIRADGTQLPFEDGSFDVITSFETLEHIANFEMFVSELRRVLHRNGVVILSTPNAKYTDPVDGIPKNPYHVYEFTPKEFQALLADQFSSVVVLGQRVSSRYRICPYWERPHMLPKDLISRLKVLLWKLIARLPDASRNFIAETLWHGTFFPGENDFVFSEAESDNGYVLVGICRI